MSPIQQARVPYVAQTDADDVAIRCGPAVIQAILYGRDDGRFVPASDVLKSSVQAQVPADQEKVWNAVKTESAAVVAATGAQSGPTEGQQICQLQPDGGRECWATHPQVMRKLIANGLHAPALDGIPAATVQELDQDDVVDAVIDSLRNGVGAAVLVGGFHWVVVHKSVPTADGDFDVFFHDPATSVKFVWRGLDAVRAAVVDMDDGESGTQTFVVGVRTKGRRPRVTAPRKPPAAVHVFDEQLPAEFGSNIRESLRSQLDLHQALEGCTASRIVRVRHEQKPSTGYFLVEFDGIATAVVDSETHRPRVIASALESGRRLPAMLEPDEIKEKVNGRSIKVGHVDITLDKGRFRIDENLVWERCDQSRSRIVPFYVLRQPRAGRAMDDRIYVRASDGRPFAQLTRTLRGA